MPSHITDITTPPQTTSFPSLTARQRLESVLGNLPPRGDALPQGALDPTEAISRDALIQPTQRINEVMRPYGVEFEVNDATSRLVTRIVDRDNGEVIRQIPAEEVLRIAERLEEVQGRLIQLEA